MDTVFLVLAKQSFHLSLSTQPNFAAAEADDGGGDAEVAAFFPAVNALGRTSGSRGTMTSKKPLMKHLKLVERFPRFLTRFRNVHASGRIDCILKHSTIYFSSFFFKKDAGNEVLLSFIEKNARWRFYRNVKIFHFNDSKKT